MSPVSTPALNRSSESRAATASGYLMLLIWLGLFAVGIMAGTQLTGESDSPLAIAVLIACVVAGTLILSGFYMIAPNEAAAIQLFGSYKGTDREAGLRWVLPWYSRKKIAVRANT